MTVAKIFHLAASRLKSLETQVESWNFLLSHPCSAALGGPLEPLLFVLSCAWSERSSSRQTEQSPQVQRRQGTTLRITNRGLHLRSYPWSAPPRRLSATATAKLHLWQLRLCSFRASSKASCKHQDEGRLASEVCMIFLTHRERKPQQYNP